MHRKTETLKDQRVDRTTEIILITVLAQESEHWTGQYPTTKETNRLQRNEQS